MECAQCKEVFRQEPLELRQGVDDVLFCSFDCLIVYSAARIRQRIEIQNRRVRGLPLCSPRRGAGFQRARHRGSRGAGTPK